MEKTNTAEEQCLCGKKVKCQYLYNTFSKNL